MTLSEWADEMQALLDRLRTSSGTGVERNPVGNLLIIDGQGALVGYIDVLYPQESDLTAYTPAAPSEPTP